MKNYSNRIIFFSLFFITSFFTGFLNAQTIRYQNNIRGGFALAANCLDLKSGTFANTAMGVKASSYSDLVLPAGSTIVKAYLYVETYGGASAAPIKSVNFRVAGSATYTTLTTASAGFLGNPSVTALTSSYCQFNIDVTSLMPANGYISTITAGGNAAITGRYAVADPVVSKPLLGAASISTGDGWGWALYVVYTNPIAKYRNVTIADACNASSATVVIPNVIVPSSGPVNAVVGITGSYGDIGLTDNATFGQTGATATILADPTTGAVSDILNSTIGFTPKNNVSQDGGPLVSGNFTARNPYNTFTQPTSGTGTWYSYFYDADIIDASGILPNSTTPISVTFNQVSDGGDALGFGAYAIAIDIAAANVTKSLSPTSIANGGLATYTFSVANDAVGAINLNGIAFTDNLPGNLRVAAIPNANITGGTGGVFTALPGTTFVTLAGLSLSPSQIATMSVDVTNVAGQLNADCTGNPAAFTNSFGNMAGMSVNLANAVTPQCLIVTLAVPISLLNFDGVLNKGIVSLKWKTESEKNAKEFVIERSTGGDYTGIGNVEAAGNSSIEKQYTFEDKNPVAGMNYYRLKATDFDGKSDYSTVIVVEVKLSPITKLMIKSAPGANLLDIAYNSTEEDYTTFKIFDVNGREVLVQGPFQSGAGLNNRQLDMSNLQTGYYFLNISNTKGYSDNVKFNK